MSNNWEIENFQPVKIPKRADIRVSFEENDKNITEYLTKREFSELIENIKNNSELLIKETDDEIYYYDEESKKWYYDFDLVKILFDGRMYDNLSDDKGEIQDILEYLIDLHYLKKLWDNSTYLFEQSSFLYSWDKLIKYYEKNPKIIESIALQSENEDVFHQNEYLKALAIDIIYKSESKGNSIREGITKDESILSSNDKKIIENKIQKINKKLSQGLTGREYRILKGYIAKKRKGEGRPVFKEDKKREEEEDKKRNKAAEIEEKIQKNLTETSRGKISLKNLKEGMVKEKQEKQKNREEEISEENRQKNLVSSLEIILKTISDNNVFSKIEKGRNYSFMGIDEDGENFKMFLDSLKAEKKKIKELVESLDLSIKIYYDPETKKPLTNLKNIRDKVGKLFSELRILVETYMSKDDLNSLNAKEEQIYKEIGEEEQMEISKNEVELNTNNLLEQILLFIRDIKDEKTGDEIKSLIKDFQNNMTKERLIKLYKKLSLIFHPDRSGQYFNNVNKASNFFTKFSSIKNRMTLKNENKILKKLLLIKNSNKIGNLKNKLKNLDPNSKEYKIIAEKLDKLLNEYSSVVNKSKMDSVSRVLLNIYELSVKNNPVEINEIVDSFYPYSVLLGKTGNIDDNGTFLGLGLSNLEDYDAFLSAFDVAQDINIINDLLRVYGSIENKEKYNIEDLSLLKTLVINVNQFFVHIKDSITKNKEKSKYLEIYNDIIRVFNAKMKETIEKIDEQSKKNSSNYKSLPTISVSNYRNSNSRLLLSKGITKKLEKNVKKEKKNLNKQILKQIEEKKGEKELMDYFLTEERFDIFKNIVMKMLIIMQTNRLINRSFTNSMSSGLKDYISFIEKGLPNYNQLISKLKEKGKYEMLLDKLRVEKEKINRNINTRTQSSKLLGEAKRRVEEREKEKMGISGLIGNSKKTEMLKQVSNSKLKETENAVEELSNKLKNRFKNMVKKAESNDELEKIDKLMKIIKELSDEKLAKVLQKKSEKDFIERLMFYKKELNSEKRRIIAIKAAEEAEAKAKKNAEKAAEETRIKIRTINDEIKSLIRSLPKNKKVTYSRRLEEIDASKNKHKNRNKQLLKEELENEILKLTNKGENNFM